MKLDLETESPTHIDSIIEDLEAPVAAEPKTKFRVRFYIGQIVVSSKQEMTQVIEMSEGLFTGRDMGVTIYEGIGIYNAKQAGHEGHVHREGVTVYEAMFEGYATTAHGMCESIALSLKAVWRQQSVLFSLEEVTYEFV